MEPIKYQTIFDEFNGYGIWYGILLQTCDTTVNFYHKSMSYVMFITNSIIMYGSFEKVESNFIQNFIEFDAFTYFGMHISSNKYFIYAR